MNESSMQELNLFIIWSNARFAEKKIIDDIKKKFKVLKIHEVIWEKSNFSNNLTRFYGENLPKGSNKERTCGNDSFLLITVIDNDPIYRERKTSKGIKIVNTKMFDSKEMYRQWTGGGHRVHATNGRMEFKHDIVLLTGLSADDYYRTYKDNLLKESMKQITSMVGEQGWSSLKQLLYVLNETVEYVVLRNFDLFPNKFIVDEHSDIDFLTSNRYLFQCISNAKPVFWLKARARYYINIGDIRSAIDIRFIGDDYFDRNWEKKIIYDRVFEKCGFYRPDEINYCFSLLYHSVVHKKIISRTYMEKFNNFREKGILCDKELNKQLNEYMEYFGYKYVEPKDFSVYFNKENTKKTMSMKKFFLKLINRLRC